MGTESLVTDSRESGMNRGRSGRTSGGPVKFNKRGSSARYSNKFQNV